MSKNFIAILTAALLLVGGCQTIEPDAPPTGEAALLQNRIVYDGQARFSFFFRKAGGKTLSPGLTTPESLARYSVPAGEITLRPHLNYTPRMRSSFWPEDQYEIYARQLTITATEGETYVVAGMIHRGRARLWIEDSAGNKVSGDLQGLKLDYPQMTIWHDLPSPVH